jgi:hypothetical protein
MTDVRSGETVRLTARSADDEDAPRPEACVFSPDGTKIAYCRNVRVGSARWNQVFVVALK